MKVISKKPIPTQTCKGCGSIVKIGYRDLKDDGISLSKIGWICPLCKTSQIVNFKGGVEE